MGSFFHQYKEIHYKEGLYGVWSAHIGSLLYVLLIMNVTIMNYVKIFYQRFNSV